MRVVRLGPVTLTLALRGNIADLDPGGDRALVFAIIDLINSHDLARGDAP
jgi:hypothetical protein